MSRHAPVFAAAQHVANCDRPMPRLSQADAFRFMQYISANKENGRVAGGFLFGTGLAIVKTTIGLRQTSQTARPKISGRRSTSRHDP